MDKLVAFLMDADFVCRNGRNLVRLFLKARDGKTLRAYDEFEPYFLVLPFGEVDFALNGLSKISSVDRSGKRVGVKRVELVKKFLHGVERVFVKVFVEHPDSVTRLREEAKKFGDVFEYSISFASRRYFIDKGLFPSCFCEIDFKEGTREVASIKMLSDSLQELPVLSKLSFDIEVFNPSGLPDSSKDACLMISYADSFESGVLLHSKSVEAGFVKNFVNEKEMIDYFTKIVRQKKVDVIFTYNGDVFDIPYLKNRSKKVKADFGLGRDHKLPSLKKRGLRGIARIPGRVHVDVFNAISFLDTIGVIRLPRLSLEKVYKELLNKEKEEVRKLDIWRMWNAGGKDLENLASYCRSDAVACFELGEFVFPLQLELSRVSGTTLFDASRSTTGQLVEALLMRKAFERNEVILNSPKQSEIVLRQEKPIAGAYVKMPAPGIYENIAVLDFRSLYPSIIVSHNIDESSLNCSCCEKDGFVSPTGSRFCKRRKALMPSVLEEVLDARFKIKKRMKELPANSPERNQLDARQQALKIVANSFYGYLVYARSRWYSREAGESVTAWGRHYIQETERKAEELGFKVLYMDTDSVFLQFKEGEEHRVYEFQKKINSELPEKMELELESIYPRGIFVSKKQEEKGAKKKYALIDKEGKIKIRGFELVRRDWSRIARSTQKEVLSILLREGNVGKAIDLVRKKIQELKEGRVPISDCVIYTQLRKSLKSYEVKAPELTAFEKARKAGIDVSEGAVVGYVITKKGKTISDKAEVQELASDYDPDYYINNQLLPAVLKILGALGVSAEDIVTKGFQQSLSSW